MEFSLSLVVLGMGLGNEEFLGMLVSDNSGMLAVLNPQIFTLTFILGRGYGGDLVPRDVGAGKIGVLELSVSQLFSLKLRGWGIYSG